MYKVNFACLFFGYLNRNSHAHGHFTCRGTLPVPVHRYRGILRSLLNYLSLLSRTTCQDPDWPVLMRQSMSVFWSADLSLKSIHPMNPSFDKQAICSQHGSFKASKWIFPTPNNEFEVESALTIRTKLPVFSIYTLSDLHWCFKQSDWFVISDYSTILTS